MAAPIRVLHVQTELSRGGASRALVTLARAARRTGRSTHRIVSLGRVADGGLAARAGLDILESPDEAQTARELEEADVVHIHFWNTPELLEWMRRLTVPSRVLLWPHVPGHTPPHLISSSLTAWADLTVRSCQGIDGAPVVLPSADFSRLQSITRRPHATFNVGYLGTVEPVKMHPEYVQMSAAIRIPDVRFIVCGSGAGFAALGRQAAECGAADRFDLRGYVENIAPFFGEIDVFGYPVIHCGAELVVQEAMFAGVPPVIFATGGAQFEVRHGETGLVVASPAEYVDAVEWLYHHPDERRRLGQNAAVHARHAFAPERTADAMDELYARLMGQPKRRRLWPFDHTAQAADRRAAWMFLDFLGDGAAPFVTSLNSHVVEEVIDAERTIGDAAPMIAAAASGGVLHYRRHFPDDASLRLWAGLVFRAQGRPALAIAEFEAARRLGVDHWRVWWYIAETARSNDADALAAEAAQRVVDLAPEWAPAQVMLASLRQAATGRNSSPASTTS